MDRYFVLTIIGEDRPGLVEALSETIAGHEGNWLESRMAHLAGKFAGILRVSVPAAHADGLERALGMLNERGLHVVAEAGDLSVEPTRAVKLELTGADHAGIVRDIATVLARRRVNVEELQTGCVPAPMSGQMLFEASATLHLPQDLSVDELRGDLEGVAGDLMVDISIEEQS